MANDKGMSRHNVLPAVVVAATSLLLLQCGSLIVPAAANPTFSSSIGYGEQKNYYSPPDPSSGGTSPPGSRGGGHGSTPRVSLPPTGGTPKSSHHLRTTPSPHDPGTPSTPSYPPPPYGGTVTLTPVLLTPPTPTIAPTLPTHPTPISVDSGTPVVPTIPAPPFYLDPNNNPFIGTYNYWRTHSTIVYNIYGFWIPLGTAFGVNGNIPGLPANYNLIQALSNTRGDDLGALYREGTAALLNSIVNSRFPFTTVQVRQSFVSSLGSVGAAGAQARLFKKANEGHMKPRA